MNNHMKTPTISLVIPAYNEEKCIGECLDHAIKHAGNKFLEIIVIDNASKDKTRQIAEGKGVKVAHEKRKGLTRARQRGFIEAKGDILAYVDADTKMPEGWFETVLEEFSKDPNLAALSGPYIYYDISPFNKFLVKLYWKFLAIPSYYISGYMVVGGNFAIRKSVLDKMNGFDTTIEFYGEDTNIARRASKFGKVKFRIDFPMHTSGRRLTGYGVFKMALIYGSNFLSEAILHRPLGRKYTDVR